jgi:hypothetical protein
VEAGFDKGRKAPEWYLDEPQLLIGDDFYVREFWHLHTTRAIGGTTYGPIPIPAIEDRAEWRFGFEDDVFDLYVAVIRAMDDGFLDWNRDEHNKTTRREDFEARRKKK